MPRKRRIDYEGAWHHVMHRGARRAPIFKVKSDCQGFLDLLGNTVEQFGLELHAFSLMPNHYHLLVRSALGNLSEAMQDLNSNYAQWINRRHRWDGPVFRGRFTSQLVEDEEYLRVLIAYIHLNPVEANLIGKTTADEGWTSYRAYMNLENAPAWLLTDFFVDLFGGKKKIHAFVESCRLGRKEYPEDFNPETGLFARKAIEPRVMISSEKKEPKTKHRLNRLPEDVLEDIQKMTGAKLRELRKTQMGPGANPARRFAIWALNRSTTLRQREIGKLLKVPYYQVGRALGYIRNQEVKEPVKGWIKRWVATE